MRKQQHTPETVRLTIDVPKAQHAFLKMLAARHGVSMRQYVIEALSKNVEREEKEIYVSDNKFKSLLKEVIKEHDAVLRRLADK